MDEIVPALGQADVSFVDPTTTEKISIALNFLSAGGPVLYLLVGLSVVTTVLIIAKTLQFSAARLGVRSPSGALARIANATRVAADLNGQEKQIEKVGGRAARRELRPLELGLGMLSMIAMLSPLIGLLGTVIGMIGAFRALGEAGGAVDPSILSAGIWVALLTTAAGLIVAIPATVAHGWFETRLSRFVDLAEEVIGEISEPVRKVPRHLGVAAD